MLLNLSQLQEKNSYLSMETSVCPDDIDFLGRQVKMPDDFNLDLDIIGEEKEIVFTGNISGKFVLACSRCLKEFARKVQASLEFTISRDNIDDYSNVDISEHVQENLILAIPIKALCRKDCSGICPECGQDLNKGECDCETVDTDPRLEKLQQYFESSE